MSVTRERIDLVWGLLVDPKALAGKCAWEWLQDFDSTHAHIAVRCMERLHGCISEGDEKGASRWQHASWYHVRDLAVSLELKSRGDDVERLYRELTAVTQ